MLRPPFQAVYLRTPGEAPLSGRMLSGAAASGPAHDAEVTDWVNRVTALGGSVSAGTRSAADAFMAAINAAGLRSKIYRLNLYAGTSTGTNMESIKEVLIKDKGGDGNGRDDVATLAGTEYSESTGIVISDNPSAKRAVKTGVVPSSHFDSVNDLHIAVYSRANLNETNNSFIGAVNSGEGASGIYMTLRITLASNQSYSLLMGDAASSFPIATDANTLGFYQCCRTSSTSCVLYKNGAVFASATGTSNGSMPNTPSIYVHAEHDSVQGADLGTAGTIAGYSIGKGMNATQALAFYNAWQDFQTALGRQV